MALRRLLLIWGFLTLASMLAACSPTAREGRGPVVFLGDSLTVYLRVTDISPDAQNYAVGGDTTADLLERLPLLSLGQARLVVLTIGTNDVLLGRTSGLEARLAAISAAIPGPLAWHAVPSQRGKDVEPVNAVIQRLCKARPDCTFVRTQFTPEDFEADGIHLGPSGYARWTATLKSELVIPAGPR